MKKILFAIFCTVFLFNGNLVKAETNSAGDGRFTIGPQGGIVFSDYSVKNAPFGSNYKNDNGFVGGVFFEMGIWAVTLRPEINYVEKNILF